MQIGVVNQTTMLASDTQAIADYLKQLIKDHYKLDEQSIGERFADTRDTLCYATLDNQSAVTGMLEQSRPGHCCWRPQQQQHFSPG